MYLLRKHSLRTHCVYEAEDRLVISQFVGKAVSFQKLLPLSLLNIDCTYTSQVYNYFGRLPIA